MGMAETEVGGGIESAVFYLSLQHVVVAEKEDIGTGTEVGVDTHCFFLSEIVLHLYGDGYAEPVHGLFLSPSEDINGVVVVLTVGVGDAVPCLAAVEVNHGGEVAEVESYTEAPVVGEEIGIFNLYERLEATVDCSSVGQAVA